MERIILSYKQNRDLKEKTEFFLKELYGNNVGFLKFAYKEALYNVLEEKPLRNIEIVETNNFITSVEDAMNRIPGDIYRKANDKDICIVRDRDYDEYKFIWRKGLPVPIDAMRIPLLLMATAMPYKINSAKKGITKIAISTQEGEAWVTRYLEPFDYEYDDKIKAILKDEKLDEDAKINAMEERVKELFSNMPEEEAKFQTVDWDEAKVNQGDLYKVLEDYQEQIEIEKEIEEEKKSKESSLDKKAYDETEMTFQEEIDYIKNKLKTCDDEGEKRRLQDRLNNLEKFIGVKRTFLLDKQSAYKLKYSSEMNIFVLSDNDKEKPITEEQLKALKHKDIDNALDLAKKSPSTWVEFKSASMKFEVGDKVKLVDDVLQRHSRSVPPQVGYTTEQFAWRKTLESLLGQVGTIERTFENSKHVNVDFDDKTIGIDDTELVLVERAKQSSLNKKADMELQEGDIVELEWFDSFTMSNKRGKGKVRKIRPDLVEVFVTDPIPKKVTVPKQYITKVETGKEEVVKSVSSLDKQLKKEAAIENLAMVSRTFSGFLVPVAQYVLTNILKEDDPQIISGTMNFQTSATLSDIPIDVDKIIPVITHITATYKNKVIQASMQYDNFNILCYAATRKEAENWMQNLEVRMLKDNQYRGKCLHIENNNVRFHRVPKVNWEDVILKDEIKRDIRMNTVSFLGDEKLSKVGVSKRGLIMYGPPGTGKTSVVKAIFNELEGKSISRIYVTAESFRRMSANRLFDLLPYLGKTVLAFEDIDMISGNRNEVMSVDSGLLGDLLTNLDGMRTYSDPIVVMASTNKISMLDDALANRPCRFDRKIEIGLPTKENLKVLYKKFSGIEVSDEVIKLSDGFTGSHVVEAVNTAKILSLYDEKTLENSLIESCNIIRDNFFAGQKLDQIKVSQVVKNYIIKKALLDKEAQEHKKRYLVKYRKQEGTWGIADAFDDLHEAIDHANLLNQNYREKATVVDTEKNETIYKTASFEEEVKKQPKEYFERMFKKMEVDALKTKLEIYEISYKRTNDPWLKEQMELIEKELGSRPTKQVKVKSEKDVIINIERIVVNDGGDVNIKPRELPEIGEGETLELEKGKGKEIKEKSALDTKSEEIENMMDKLEKIDFNKLPKSLQEDVLGMAGSVYRMNVPYDKFYLWTGEKKIDKGMYGDLEDLFRRPFEGEYDYAYNMETGECYKVKEVQSSLNKKTKEKSDFTEEELKLLTSHSWTSENLRRLEHGEEVKEGDIGYIQPGAKPFKPRIGIKYDSSNMHPIYRIISKESSLNIQSWKSGDRVKYEPTLWDKFTCDVEEGDTGIVTTTGSWEGIYADPAHKYILVEWEKSGRSGVSPQSLKKASLNIQSREKTDIEIEKEFADYEIKKIELKPSKQSGTIEIYFPHGGEHVAGGQKTVVDNFVIQEDGSIYFDYWYPEKVTDVLVKTIHLKGKVKETESALDKQAGRDYTAISKEEFQSRIEKGKYEVATASTEDMLLNPMKYIKDAIRFETIDYGTSEKPDDGLLITLKDRKFIEFEQIREAKSSLNKESKEEKIKYKFGDRIQLKIDPKNKGTYLFTQDSKPADIDLVIFFDKAQIDKERILEVNPTEIIKLKETATEEQLEEATEAMKEWKKKHKKYEDNFDEKVETVLEKEKNDKESGLNKKIYKVCEYPFAYFKGSREQKQFLKEKADEWGLKDIENEDLTPKGLIQKMIIWDEGEHGVEAYYYDMAKKQLEEQGYKMPKEIRRTESLQIKSKNEELVKKIKEIIRKRTEKNKFALMESMSPIEERIRFQINQGETDPEQIATYVIDEYDEAIFEARSSLDLKAQQVGDFATTDQYGKVKILKDISKGHRTLYLVEILEGEKVGQHAEVYADEMRPIVKGKTRELVYPEGKEEQSGTGYTGLSQPGVWVEPKANLEDKNCIDAMVNSYLTKQALSETEAKTQANDMATKDPSKIYTVEETSPGSGVWVVKSRPK